MRIFIFGLTITSSWGNGHATIWRGLCRSLIKKGHFIKFFEKDVSYYADQRDLNSIPGMKICLYKDLKDLYNSPELNFEECDTAIVTSYSPYEPEISEMIWEKKGIIKIFYDLDTPVTINEIKLGKQPPYIHPTGLSEFDLVLSYTGGSSVFDLQNLLGAKKVFPLYGSADPFTHFKVETKDRYTSDFSYLGTYSKDRQNALEIFFLEAAKFCPEKKFLLGGSMYPSDILWPENVFIINHVSPPDHPAFYSSSKFTLNITRKAMADSGYCPSGRLFEAALCEAPIISDYWEGLEQFFIPGKEIIIVESTEDVLSALEMEENERLKIIKAAKEKVLKEHIAYNRASEFENILQQVSTPSERIL